VSAFADTSFLFAFYFPRVGSEQAMAKMESLQNPALVSSLVRFEFQQAKKTEVTFDAGTLLSRAEVFAAGQESSRKRRVKLPPPVKE